MEKWQILLERLLAVDPATLMRDNSIDGGTPITRLQYREPDRAKMSPVTADLNDFCSLAATGVVPPHEFDRVRDKINAILTVIRSNKQKVDDRLLELNALMAELKHSTPIQLVAIEQMISARRYLSDVALQATPANDKVATLAVRVATELLEFADAYTWSSEVVEAVSDAAANLPSTAIVTESGMGLLAAPSAAGWWWFNKAIPINGIDVHAILWHRAPDMVSDNAGTRFWVFKMEPVARGGRRTMVPVPVAVFEWPDLYDVSSIVERWRNSKNNNWTGYEGGLDTGVEVSLWLSKFWLAAGTWLQQKIVVSSETKLPRQPGRALQREHKLESVPTVQVIHLRRSTYTKSEGEVVVDKEGKRQYSHRWVVHGFWRSQWYARKQEHATIWIDSFIKGPSDKPLVSKTKVYAVDR